MRSCLFPWWKCSLCFWIKNDHRGGPDDNRGQRRDKPVGLSPAPLAKPLISLWEKPLQTRWFWCIRTLMVHAADLSGRWVHSNNTHRACLHPWDDLMRMYPLSDDSGGRAAACSCHHQGFNHSPLSAWHTQGTAAPAAPMRQLLCFVPPEIEPFPTLCCTTVAGKNPLQGWMSTNYQSPCRCSGWSVDWA